MTTSVQAKPFEGTATTLSQAERRALKKASYQQQKQAQQNEQSKRVFTPFERAFFGTQLTPALIQLIDAYGQMELNLEYPDPFHTYCDLRDQELLKRSFSQKCQTKEHLSAAKSIIDLTFHAACQDTIGTDSIVNGLQCISPEVYVYVMEFLKKTHQSQPGKTVLEIGAARGYCSLLLGFSDASKIYVNDHNKDEMNFFKNHRDRLPPDIQKKMYPVPGDCLKKATFKAIGRNQVDFVLNANLLHFFSPPQMQSLFKNVNFLLKPGGLGLFITNGSANVIEGGEEILNPDAVCYETISCEFRDLEFENRINLWKIIRDRVDQVYKCATQDFFLYKKVPGSQWQEDAHSMKQLDMKLQKRVRCIMELEAMEQPHSGQVIVRKIPVQLFNKKTLTTLFTEHGLEVVTIFRTGAQGHIERSSNARHIGIICKKPSDKV